MEHFLIRGVFFPLSHNGCVIQHVQVPYTAHVTSIPEDLDIVLLPWRILTRVSMTTQHIPRDELVVLFLRRAVRSKTSGAQSESMVNLALNASPGGGPSSPLHGALLLSLACVSAFTPTSPAKTKNHCVSAPETEFDVSDELRYSVYLLLHPSILEFIYLPTVLLSKHACACI